MGRVWARFINTLVRDIGMTSNSRGILVLGASLLMIAVFGMSTMSGMVGYFQWPPCFLGYS